MNSYGRRVSKITSLSLALLAAASSQAASLTKVSQSEWQAGVSLPSYTNMYLYVPDSRVAKPPVLVASHHCQGTGTTTFNETKSTFVSQADKNGYIIIFPEATSHNCWDVGSAKALKHDGGGDTHAIAQMVRYTLAKYGADAARVYAFGGSSGGMMTQALLGIYPDIFMAGVAVSGVPCGCWADGYSGDVATNGQWSNACAGGSVTKTAQAWGTLVRSMFPNYTGRRARVQLWHGDPDSIISFVNFGEAIKEWTNVLGLSSTPAKTDNPAASTTHQTWNNACGFKVLETFAIKGANHAVQWDLATASSFLGLDKVGGQDPELAACPGAGGGTGVGGAGAGGASTGGSASGGATAGGTKASGGSSSSATAGGTKASGGSSNSGSAAGGAPPTLSSNPAGGTVTVGGTTGNAAAATTGGHLSVGGYAAQGGSVMSPSGGAAAFGGTVSSNSETVAAAASGEGASSDSCNCAVPRQRSSGRFLGLVVGALALRLRRRRRLSA